ncbi:nucleoside 2-deoxyribosyltransferase [Vibrio albus]|uniref:Nucleoside 2-deoxyribosyltransferase n=1 Tax=Vibrio albus TaxID=2200953 RepID=A0A2U3BDN4_9VIBR|nr:DUF4406 domain-containing protein [Vibrio albus]PWI34852.1 nucleoside 2-deoxyribosyltransferase [Vibrio albus]
MKTYIAGPMTGYDNFNRDAFHAKADQLKGQGHYVLNPATLPDGLTQAEYMDICFAMIRAAEAVYFLPKWEESEGAVAEYHYAKKIGLKLICAETLVSLAA